MKSKKKQNNYHSYLKLGIIPGTLLIIIAVVILTSVVFFNPLTSKTPNCDTVYSNANQTTVKNSTGKFAIYMPPSWTITQSSDFSTQFYLFDDPAKETLPEIGSISIYSDHTKIKAQKMWEDFQKNKKMFEAYHYITNTKQVSQDINCHPAQVITYQENRTLAGGQKVNLSNKLIYIDFGKHGHAYLSITWSNDNPQAQKDIDTFITSLTFENYDKYPAPKATRWKTIQNSTKQVKLSLPNSWLIPLGVFGTSNYLQYNDGSNNDFFGNVIEIQINLGEAAKERKEIYDTSDADYFSDQHKSTSTFNGYPAEVTTFKEKRIISKDLVVDRTHKNYYITLGNNNYVYVSTQIANASREYEPEMNQVLSTIQFSK